MEKTKGEVGYWRRAAGVWFAIATATAIFLDGFKFYEISDYRLIWAGGAMAVMLLIAGIAKDVTEIIKSKIK